MNPTDMPTHRRTPTSDELTAELRRRALDRDAAFERRRAEAARARYAFAAARAAGLRRRHATKLRRTGEVVPPLLLVLLEPACTDGAFRSASSRRSSGDPKADHRRAS